MFNIKNMRNRTGMTQRQAAEALEVKLSCYGDWERETTTPNLKDAIKMADLFDCTLDELAGRNFPKGENATIDAHDRNMVDVYHAVDGRGKTNIDNVISAEARYIDEQAKNVARTA